MKLKESGSEVSLSRQPEPPRPARRNPRPIPTISPRTVRTAGAYQGLL